MADDLRLRPPRHPIDPRARAYWRAVGALTALPVVLVLGMLALILPPARPWLLLGAALAGVLGLAYVAVVPGLRYQVHRWEVTDAAVYTRSGWLWQQWRVAPLSRIQTVDTARGPVERYFRLSGVTVTTASAAGPLTITGLDVEVAAELADRLTAITQASPGDAT